MKRLKKVGLVFAFLLLVITLKPAMAQAPNAPVTPAPSTTTTQPATSGVNLYGNVAPDVPKNLHTLTQTTVIEVLSSVVCMLSGRDPLNPQGKCLGIDVRTGQIGYASSTGGAAQVMGSLIGGTMAIPVSGTDYASYAVNNFGIAKTTYAQNTNNGIGFNALNPLVNVWSKFRDLAYLAFVLAFTVIGLAIMFRVKIDARTVMTIQNQIPKIVIALVMVTFSYAIAGFLIDLMYVSIYLVIIMFSSISDTPMHVSTNASIFTVFNRLFSPGLTGGHYGIIGLTGDVSTGVGATLSGLASDFFNSTISGLFSTPFLPFNALDIGCAVFGNIGKIALTGGISLAGYIPWLGGKLQDLPYVGGIFGGGNTCNFEEAFFHAFFFFLFTVVAYIIVLVAIIFTLFRVWFSLIKSFAYILLDCMIGPLWITAGIFPGSKLGFGTWIRHLMAHLSVFPMTFAVILLGKVIMDAVSSNGDQLFAPPLVGDTVGGNTAIAAFIGFGFIISLPSILEKTRKVVGAIDFGLVDVKKAAGVGFGVPRGGVGTVAQAKTPGHDITKAPGFLRTFSKKIQ